MNDGKYSVLMTVYKNDNAEYFDLALESMFSQTVPTDDFVLVCDGPLKNEHNEIINKYRNIYGDIFNVVRLEENKGLWNALNVGIGKCKNQLIARMDSDDIAFVNRCEKQLKVFHENKNLMYLGSYVKEFLENVDNVVSERRVPLEQNEIIDFARRRNPFNHPSVMYKKDVILGVGGYKKMRRCEDYDMAVRVLMSGAECKNIDESLLYYRLTDDSFDRRKNWSNTKGFIYVRYLNFKRGFSSIFDLLLPSVFQVMLCMMPIGVTKVFYQKVLRK